MNLDEIADAEIAEEVKRDVSVGYFEADLQDLPLTRLRDRTFEILAHALATVHINTGASNFTRATLLRVGADDGRDVLLLCDENVAGIIQCKRYEKPIPLPMVLRELMRFALRAVRNPRLVPDPYGFAYEFWTAGELTGPALSFFDAPQAYIETNQTALLGATRKARVGVEGLAVDNPKQAEAEEAAAIAMVAKFSLSTVGPVEIKSRLADQPIVRRRFFRGPNDGPQQATAADVARLLDAMRREHSAGGGETSTYVPRATLVAEFERFMASPARIFAIVGTNGQGKSHWAAQQRSRPPVATQVEIVRGDDIEGSDQHVVDTLARLLQSQRLGPLSEVDLKQAVFDWLDDASRVLIIDGLDRAPSPKLHDWLTKSFALTACNTLRFVVTSRPIAWAAVAPDIKVNRELIHRPVDAERGNFPSVGLGLLSDAEAAEIYVAYGLPAPRLFSRPFRIPGLIAQEARVRGAADSDVGTRAAVLSESLAALQRQLQRAASIGSQQFAQLIEQLGKFLVEDGQGRIQASRFRTEAPGLVSVLDAFITAGAASVEREQIRIEPDDLVEYLMALRLDPPAARDLVDKIGSDLAIGAAALTVARLEPEGHNQVRAALAALLKGTRHTSAATAAASRAIVSLKNPALIREQVEAMLDSWTLPNFLLRDSPIPLMLEEIDVPATERLDFIMRLAPGEDVWDWRGKYFYDANIASLRTITPFGATAARVVAADPSVALRYMLERFDAADQTGQRIDDYESVESGLLYMAIDAAPDEAAAIGWDRLPNKWMLKRVTHNQPIAVARILNTAPATAAEREFAAKLVWSLAYEPPMDSADDQTLRTALAAAATLLRKLIDPRQRVQMLVARLRAEPDPILAAQVTESWRHVDDEIFWLALEVLPESRLALFAARFSGTDHPSCTDDLLARIPVGLFPIEEWPLVIQVLEDAATNGLAVATALGLETLLYRAAAEDQMAMLMPLARKLAASEDAKARRALIFFAGGSVTPVLPGAIQAREELLGILTEHEDGEDLDTLTWKLAQSAPLFTSAMANIVHLCNAFGAAEVDAALDRYNEVERDGMHALFRQWMRLPKAERPNLPTVRNAGHRRSV